MRRIFAPLEFDFTASLQVPSQLQASQAAFHINALAAAPGLAARHATESVTRRDDS
jgi:hypothetical protein